MPRKVYRRRNRKGLARLNKRLNRLEYALKPEKKRAINVSMASTAIGNDSVYDESILDLASGTSQHQRIGNQVKITSYHGKFLIKQFSGDQNAIYRFVFYTAKDNSDELSKHNGPTTALGFTERIDLDRFNVLKDFNISMQKTGASSSGSLTDIAYYKPFTLARRFKKPVLQVYDSASVGSHKQGNIRLFITFTTGVLNCPLVDGELNVYYTDV